MGSKPKCRLNVEERLKNVSNVLYTCRKTLGEISSLSPRLVMHLIYTEVIIIFYAVLVWWPAVQKRQTQKGWRA